MRRGAGFGLLLLAAAALVSAPAPAQTASSPARRSTGPRITVDPGHGWPGTRFTVSFTAPDAAGLSGGLEREYVVALDGPRPTGGCVGGGTVAVTRARAHARVRVTLSPRTLGGRWCAGRYRGEIDELGRPVCPTHKLCPEFIVMIRTVGHFGFRVNSRAAGSDRQAPSFAGLISAMACTPGAQRPGQTTPFELRWDPAGDNVSPSAQIVYDVYESATAGGEDFSQPTWTTAPGLTSFRTPGLPSHGSFYFVVRARDHAGNEDRNRVERHGVDPCV